MLAVLGALQAYPVAGSQISYAAALFIPLGAMGIAEGWRAIQRLPSASTAASKGLRYGYKAVFSAIVVATMYVALSLQPTQAFLAYRAGVALGLPGTSMMRLPNDQAAGLREVAAVLKTNCDTFESLPGLNSFYPLAGEPAPTGFNSTSWPWQFTPDRQMKIVDASRTYARQCAVVNRGVLLEWARGRAVPSGPLVDYIEHEFPHRLYAGYYEVWARS
jgi:hypothetical protein